ncbi:MAG: helix-turn-helix transcriptional regulator [Bacteroidales bacterium]|nr:helix-turn-helix transcriptional regulator [Bacteroidales bacterium]
MFDKQNKPALETLRSKLFLWTVIPAALLGAGVLIYFYSLDDLHIYPDPENFRISFYTDTPIGGNSRITDQQVTDSCISIRFILGDTLDNPYVGISIAPKNDAEFRIGRYNQMRITSCATKLEKLGISIIAPGKEANEAGQLSDIYYYTTRDITESKVDYSLDLKQFVIPDWWMEANRDHPLKKSSSIRKISAINIGNAYTPNIGQDLSMEIYAITFTRNNRKLLLSVLGIELLVFVLAFASIFLIRKLSMGKHSITIRYQPIAAAPDKKGPLDFMDVINRNFNKSELSLEFVCRETGVSQRKITTYVQTEFACNFKTYINRLRLTEAKRLLMDTDLNIGEIAFKVGFNNQSHFNRVFKEMMGSSPTEYRSKDKMD